MTLSQFQSSDAFCLAMQSVLTLFPVLISQKHQRVHHIRTSRQRSDAQPWVTGHYKANDNIQKALQNKLISIQSMHR